MGLQKFKVTGISGQSEVIEAHSPIAANGIFVEHHAEPAHTTVLVKEATIHEKDTARG